MLNLISLSLCITIAVSQLPPNLRFSDNFKLQDGKESIVHGHPAAMHNWPSMVRLTRKGHTECGGVLINKKWVLTAAHCRPDHAVLGEHNTLVPGSSVWQQDSDVKRYVGHKSFRMSSFNHDIALLELVTPINYTDGVRPSRVISPLTKPRLSSAHTCFITGWGSTRGTGSNYILREATVSPMNNEQCRRLYQRYRPEHSGIRPTHICIGSGIEGAPTACNGDSGGPLYCVIGGQVLVSGVTSFGPTRCRRDEGEQVPTVYTNVLNYAYWIRYHAWGNYTRNGARPSLD